MATHPNWVWGTPFFDADTLDNTQLLFVTLIYSLILYQSSNLISDGSEFLLLIPSVAGLVGSIVLPILGAVPDGMMTLCSGLNPNHAAAQREVSAGVGVLAGSTVMLLTFPWFVALIYGRVPLNSKREADYGRNREVTHLTGSGVTFKKAIPDGAKLMLVTTLLYLIVQIPAYHEEQVAPGEDLVQSQAESRYALIGMIASGVFFMAYLVISYVRANEDTELDFIIQSIKDRDVSLRGALASASTSAGESLNVETTRLKKILRPFFIRYDEDHSGELDLKEFELLLKDLGESISHGKVQTIFEQFDTNKSNTIGFEEAVKCVDSYLTDPTSAGSISRATRVQRVSKTEETEAEDEEIPEDLADLSPAEQRRAILFRATWMMSLGTAMVVWFSDPLVDCLNEWGTRFDINAFYVAFVVAPFASNASELLSAYNYAAKKTSKSITTALSTLLGAACMNNTFVLGIFFGLMYFQELAWQFTAETIAIVVVQWIIGLIALFKSTHTPFMGFVILSMYPACLFLVNFLENTVGLD